MKHEFDGTVYYNHMPLKAGQATGHVDKKKICGFAVWGLFPWKKEPSRGLVPTTGKETTISEIKTQFTILDIIISGVLNYFIGGGVIFQPRTLYVEGDYIRPEAGPAKTDAVYQ
ncbi:MAG: hypothetical protein Q8R92_13615 [Deltaproteobacteria bacterium]|nr:hypothetical protein [Deltaproteobacteria bacterium]